MPRIRTIKPAAFASETLSQLPREMRWTFAGLWTYVDDEGRGRYNPRLIKAELYPLDDDVDADTVECELAKLEGLGLICRYEIAGRRYLHVVGFGEHQKVNRPVESKLPECPLHVHGGLSEDSVNPHEPITEDSPPEGKGREGKGRGREASPRGGDDTADYDSDPNFIEFWEVYPRKVGKPAAHRAWKAAMKRRADPRQIIQAAGKYRDDPKRKPEFTKHPGPWLNDERYNDQPDAPEPQRTGGAWWDN